MELRLCTFQLFDIAEVPDPLSVIRWVKASVWPAQAFFIRPSGCTQVLWGHWEAGSFGFESCEPLAWETSDWFSFCCFSSFFLYFLASRFFWLLVFFGGALGSLGFISGRTVFGCVLAFWTAAKLIWVEVDKKNNHLVRQHCQMGPIQQSLDRYFSLSTFHSLFSTNLSSPLQPNAWHFS